jgi:uncharacterized protein
MLPLALGHSRARMTNRERTAPPTIYCEAHRSARTRGGLVSQSTTAYLTEKCEVRNRDVAGGKAVYARELIEPGEVIAVWSGRLVSAEELDDLPEDIRRHTAQVEEGFYLASLNPDEAPDYINHSCEPNAGLDGQITIVAMVTIRPGDEVTIDYAMCDGSPYDEFDCACGSSHCRGRVTGNDWCDTSLWKRYAGHFSPYLQRRIDALQAERSPRWRVRKRAAIAPVHGANGNLA